MSAQIPKLSVAQSSYSENLPGCDKTAQNFNQVLLSIIGNCYEQCQYRCPKGGYSLELQMKMMTHCVEKCRKQAKESQIISTIKSLGMR